MHTNTLPVRRIGWSQIDNRYRWGFVALALSMIGGLGWSSFYHHTQFVAADSARIAALSKTQIQQKTINELTTRERALLAADSRRTRELADARATIRRLQNSGSVEKSHL